MPFTFSHPAAAAILWPAVRRGRLPLAPFAIGAMAPDFEYLLRLEPYALVGHTFPGVLTLTVPAGAVVLGWWEWRGRAAVRELLAFPRERATRSAAWWGTAALALGAGIASHVVWDAFTHWDAWGAAFIPALAEPVTTTIPGLHWAGVLQHLSTVVGGAVVARWLFRQLHDAGGFAVLRERWRLRVFAAIFALCAVLAVWNAPRTGAMTDPWPPRIVAGRAVVGALLGLAVGLGGYSAVFAALSPPHSPSGSERIQRREVER